MDGSLADAKTLCIDEIFLNVFIGNFLYSNALFLAFVDKLIVNIGKVLYKGYLVAEIFEKVSKAVKTMKGLALPKWK